ncbi:MAG: hypothetical protein V2A54_00120 [Bacteroidota bacterium]
MKYTSYFRNFFLKSRSRMLTRILSLTGLCGVLVLFEACYGTPQNFEPVNESTNLNFYGQVLSADSLKPIPGAEVLITGSDYPYDSTYTYASSTGAYDISFPYSDSYDYTLIAFDNDDTINGHFKKADTLVKVSSRDKTMGKHKNDILLKRIP